MNQSNYPKVISEGTINSTRFERELLPVPNERKKIVGVPPPEAGETWGRGRCGYINGGRTGFGSSAPQVSPPKSNIRRR